MRGLAVAVVLAGVAVAVAEVGPAGAALSEREAGSYTRSLSAGVGDRVDRSSFRYRQRYVVCRRVQALRATAGRGTYQDARRCRQRIDFHKALRFSTRFWGAPYACVHETVHREGGHGPAMIWNHQGSGAFGPGQFLKGTWDWMSREAFKQARARGLRFSPVLMGNRYAPSRNDTLFGQAFTMAWAFAHGLNHHWAARAC